MLEIFQSFELAVRLFEVGQLRGGPHAGAFRRRSFTDAESDSNRNPRAPPVIHLLVSSQQILMVTQFPSALQLLPEFFRTAPLTRHISSRISRILRSETLFHP
jgi:hypothetical protein